MIDVQNLGFRYKRRGNPLFANLNLHLPAGTLCGLLGANGAGKSTLLKILAGLSFPQQGRCKVLGHEPGERLPEFLADIFLLPEEFQLPAIEAVRLRSTLRHAVSALRSRTVRAAAHRTAVPRPQKLNTLSQGQKKKVLLAFGLATQARLMILDEPTNGLDIPSKAQFRRLLIDHFDSRSAAS